MVVSNIGPEGSVWVGRSGHALVSGLQAKRSHESSEPVRHDGGGGE
jgi:hypothetical protein